MILSFLLDRYQVGYMKRVEALVHSDRLREVREALKSVGATGLTITTAKGQGSADRPMVGGGRGTGRHIAEYNAIEVIMTVVEDSMVDKVVDAILDAASTGSKGDGKVFVTDVIMAADIGTKTKGSSALK